MLRRRAPAHLFCVYLCLAVMAAAGIGVTNEDIAGDRGFAEDRGPLRSDCPFTARPRAASENGTTRPAQYSNVLD